MEIDQLRETCKREFIYLYVYIYDEVIVIGLVALKREKMAL